VTLRPLLLAAMVASRAAPSAEPSEKPGLMKLLAANGLHDSKEETWNAYGQFTYISSWKPSFPAAYTNLNGSTNSLLPNAERSFTASATLLLGLKLWSGGAAYFGPEIIAERPFSELRGLSIGIQNFELQKTGGAAPQLYRSRAYLQQTFGLGGGAVDRESDQLQLGGRVDRRRIVFSLGNVNVLDFFDKNSFTSDTRQLFLGMGFMTHAAWDFASDARGYSWGGIAELYFDDWALRFSRLSPPIDPNQLPVELRLDRYYGDSVEIEHQHALLGQEGAVRVLAFRNHEVMGRFDDAIAAFRADPKKNAASCSSFNYHSANATAPDLCWVRRSNVKAGIGLDLEQHLTEDAGFFFRAMYADGQTEVQAYTSADRSLAFGGVSKGSAWNRPADVTGIGAGVGWVSQAHADYLRLGGIDGFIGDGAIREAPEASVDVFYSVNFLRAFWLTGDYQHVWNPGFNADRGPVNVFGLRFHAQY
jgi:hypothetical protein